MTSRTARSTLRGRAPLPRLRLGGLALGLVTALGAGTAAWAATSRAAVPFEPDATQARALAIAELAQPEYQAARPGLGTRIVNWVLDGLSWVLNQLASIRFPRSPSAWLLIGVILVAVLAAVVYAIWKSPGLHLKARSGRDAGLFDGVQLSAGEHRAAADRAADAGEWRLAVVERFRAIVRELEERAVLVPQPGRTANEVAHEAGAWLPDLRKPLDAGALIFDDVRYGDRSGDAEADAILRRLDEQVRRARAVATPVAVPTQSVPS